ncbi:hypothetical protein Tco_1227231 [Tanacetum coccineum]
MYTSRRKCNADEYELIYRLNTSDQSGIQYSNTRNSFKGYKSLVSINEKPSQLEPPVSAQKAKQATKSQTTQNAPSDAKIKGNGKTHNASLANVSVTAGLILSSSGPALARQALIEGEVAIGVKHGTQINREYAGLVPDFINLPTPIHPPSINKVVKSLRRGEEPSSAALFRRGGTLVGLRRARKQMKNLESDSQLHTPSGTKVGIDWDVEPDPVRSRFLRILGWSRRASGNDGWNLDQIAKPYPCRGHKARFPGSFRMETQNQNGALYTYVHHEISVLVGAHLGHLRYLFTMCRPSQTSPPGHCLPPDRPARSTPWDQKEGSAPLSDTARNK